MLQKEGESTVSVMMTLSPKLFMKLVIENNYPIKTQGVSSVYHTTRVYVASLGIVIRMKISHKELFVVHDPETLETLKSGGVSKLSVINDYFGSSVALYFGWLQFYSNYLIVPAIAGCLLLLFQLYTSKVF